MKRYFLKQNVDEEKLLEYGFEILDTPAGIAAIYSTKDDLDSLITILKPPIREVKTRYQNHNSNIDELVKPIKDILDERNV